MKIKVKIKTIGHLEHGPKRDGSGNWSARNLILEEDGSMYPDRFATRVSGEAADIFIPKYDFASSDGERHTNIDIARTWFEWIRTNTDFDQVILETSNRKDFWLHVSCRRDRRLNRHNHIAFLLKN